MLSVWFCWMVWDEFFGATVVGMQFGPPGERACADVLVCGGLRGWGLTDGSGVFVLLVV